MNVQYLSHRVIQDASEHVLGNYVIQPWNSCHYAPVDYRNRYNIGLRAQYDSDSYSDLFQPSFVRWRLPAFIVSTRDPSMLKSDFKDIIKKACFKSRGRPFNGRLDKVRRVLQLQYLRLLRIVFYIGFRYNIKASCEFRKEAQQAQSSTVKENHGSLKTICFAVSIPYLVKAIFLLTKTELK